eukprot:14247921-Alexandrium_andersonii.AAC.1
MLGVSLCEDSTGFGVRALSRLISLMGASSRDSRRSPLLSCVYVWLRAKTQEPGAGHGGGRPPRLGRQRHRQGGRAGARPGAEVALARQLLHVAHELQCLLRWRRLPRLPRLAPHAGGPQK